MSLDIIQHMFRPLSHRNNPRREYFFTTVYPCQLGLNLDDSNLRVSRIFIRVPIIRITNMRTVIITFYFTRDLLQLKARKIAAHSYSSEELRAERYDITFHLLFA